MRAKTLISRLLVLPRNFLRYRSATLDVASPPLTQLPKVRVPASARHDTRPLLWSRERLAMDWPKLNGQCVLMRPARPTHGVRVEDFSHHAGVVAQRAYGCHSQAAPSACCHADPSNADSRINRPRDDQLSYWTTLLLTSVGATGNG